MAVITNHETGVYNDNDSDARTPAVKGWTIFAATMMILVGVFDIIYGIAAIVRDQFFVVGVHYLYKFDVTTWGWIQLVLGAVVLLGGIALFGDAMWARVLGVGLVSLTMIANFMALPYYPVWSIIVIALSTFVIWALISPRDRY